MQIKQNLVRYRWFFLGCIALGLNGYGVFKLTRPPVERIVTAVQAELTPGAEAMVQGEQELRWDFPTEMVSTQEVGVWRVDAPVIFDPAVDGRFCWKSSQQLVFTPEQPWPACAEYQALLDEVNLTDLSGRSVLSSPMRLRGVSLDALAVTQKDFTPDRRATYALTFNAPPVRGALHEHIQIKDTRGQVVKYEILGEVKDEQVLLRTEMLRTDQIRLIVKKGLASETGPHGTADDKTFTITYQGELHLSGVEPTTRSLDANRIDADFNTSLKMDGLEDYVKVDPPVEFVVERLSGWRSTGLRLIGDFEAGRRYAVTFKRGLAAENDALLTQDETRQVYFADRPPSIDFRHGGHILSSHGNRRIALSTVNVDEITLSAQQVFPNNLLYYTRKRTEERWRYRDDAHEGLGHDIGKVKIALDAKPNEIQETRVSLVELLKDHPSGVFYVEAHSKGAVSVGQLVVVTDIGLCAKRSGSDILIWANGIKALNPLEGTRIRVYSRSNQLLAEASTDAAGLAHLKGKFTGPQETPYLIVAEHGEDISLLDFREARVNRAGKLNGRAYPEAGSSEGYVVCDRGIYRPGETCHMHAVVRDDAYQARSGFPVELRVIQPDGQPFTSATRVLSEYGTAGMDIPFPDFAMTGGYRLQVRLPGADEVIGERSIQVEEFVPPQIAVKVEDRHPKAPLDETGRFMVNVTSRHLFGRPAADLPASARVEFSPTAFCPDGDSWKGYKFGDSERGFRRILRPVWKGRLDADGQATVAVKANLDWRPPSALKAIVGATVTELGGRGVSGYVHRMVHIYPHYLGIRPASLRPAVGAPTKYELAALTPDSQAVAGERKIEVKVSRISWSYALKKNNSGTWSYQSERRLQEVKQETLLLKDGQGSYRFTPPAAGQYLLRLRDPESKPDVTASLTFYASAGSDSADAWAMEHPDRIELTPDRDQYPPGDTARILVKSPFAGRGLVTLEADRVLHYKVRELSANTAEVEIPIPADAPPTVYVAVSVLRALQTGTQAGSPRASGVIPLAVIRPERELTLSLEAPEQIRPQTRLESRIRIVDAQGRPVQTELVVAAVDEGICMLSDFKLPDPLKWFRKQRRLGVGLFDLYSLLMPELEDWVRGGPSAPGGGLGSSGGRRLNPIKARRFKPTALWSGVLHSDTNGMAIARFDVPEFTGELRLMAVAIGKSRTGAAQSSVWVKRPLIVRSSLPRFLAPGDTCRMPVQVFNEMGTAQTVHCVVQTSGPVEVLEQPADFELPAGESRSLDIALRATDAVGAADIKVQVSAGEEHFEEHTELAVRPATSRQWRGGYAVVRPGEQKEFTLPGGWVDGTGEQLVTASGLPALALAGGLEYLLKYPYGCLEQTTSASFPLLYLADLVEQVRPGSITREDCAQYVQAGIYRILSMQLSNGGFAYWPHSRSSYDWGALYAIHFLVEAQRAGYDVPESRLEAALEYCAGLLKANAYFMPTDPESQKWVSYMNLRASACRILAVAGKPQHGWMERLRETASGLDTASIVNLAAAYTATGHRDVASKLLQLPAIDREGEALNETGELLNSGARNLAVLLSAWLDIDPAAAQVPVLAERLNQRQRKHGRWRSTQENAMALMALGRYARVLKEQAKPFTAQLRAGDKKWPVDDRHPLRILPKDADVSTLSVTNQGPGTLYLHWESSGVPVDIAAVEPDADHQLRVRRSLLDANQKSVDPMALQQGELYVVKLSLDTRGERIDNLVIDDLLPAGLEVENARLKTSAILPWVREKQNLSLRHLEQRDDRVLIFANRLQGKYTYYYAVRAVTAGTFVLPAISAECMYDPAIRSRHGAGKVKVAE